MKKVIVLLGLLILLSAKSALAANSTISGVVSNIDGTTCNLCTVGFNSQTTQTIAGTAYQPKFVTTTTDNAGNLAPITLPQGLAVQITVSEGGTTFPAFTAIIPFLSTATFNQLNQGILSNPLNVLASLQPPTGPLSMNNQKITTLACPSNSGDALAWGCNATVNNLTVTGGFTQNTSGAAFFGLLSVSMISNPSAPTVVAVGTTGATSYTYFVACHDGNGGTTLASSGTTITNGNATLNGTNYNQITFTIPAHALNCDILKTDTAHSVALAQTVSPYLDQGGGSSAYTAPTRNTTGDGQFAGAITAGTIPSGIATGDISASRAAGTGKLWLGSNGSQSFDFGLTNASNFTLVGGGLVLPTGTLAVANAETVGTTLGVTGATTLTGGIAGTLSLNGATSGAASLKAAAIAGTPTTLVLPTVNGVAGSVLQNDGSGNTSWTALSPAGRSNLQTGNPLNTVSNSTSETTLFTYSLPGGTLTATGALRCHAEGNYLNNSGGSASYTLKFYYGAAAILQTQETIGTPAATPGMWSIDATLATIGATNTEWATMNHQQSATGADNTVLGMPLAASLSRNATVAVDSTANQTVKLTGTMGSNTATQTLNIFDSFCQLQ